MQYVLDRYSFSLSRACGLVGLSRSSWHYRSGRDDSEVIDMLDSLSDQKPEEGFWKLYGRIRMAGLEWNHKRVHRVYKMMGLNLKRKKKRRLPARVKEPLTVSEAINETWSADFMSDVLTSGRRFRVFTLIDDFNRECLALEVDSSLAAERVVRILDRVLEARGKPEKIRMDNGPEFISHAFGLWAERNEVQIQFIQPGKPTQNGYIERFNKSYRSGVLDAYLFDSMQQVRHLSEIWRMDYNYHRPHDALGRIAPVRVATFDRTVSLVTYQ